MKQSSVRNYVGLATTFHDSGLAIVGSRGQILFAEATERPMQYKRAINISPDVVHQFGELIDRHCEPGAQIVVASSWRAQFERELGIMLENCVRERNQFQTESERITREFAARSCIRSVSFSGRAIDYELMRVGWRKGSVGEVRSYQHHLTHAATACFTSPFKEATCAVSDGFGEDSAVRFFSYLNGSVYESAEAPSSGPGSLGLFFLEVCELCGFSYFSGEEWKVMGLAAHGTEDAELEELLRNLVRIDGLNVVPGNHPEQLRDIRAALDRRRRRPDAPAVDAANIARAGQKVFCDLTIELLNNLYQSCPSENLILAGGCALNSSCNGKILESTPFKRVHIFSAPADDGNAIGAALLAYYEDHSGEKRVPSLQSPYLGSEMSRETLNNVKRFNAGRQMRVCSDPARCAAEMLATGKVIGWIQGRAEFGPRALGNRSILADPRSHTIKDHINSRVKFREEFRPFAPAILHEFGPEFFENYQEAPYMERTLRFRPAMAARVPGVVHEDGTGRLQTVKMEWNELFYKLIYNFYELTGVPIVLNTSFNVMGKPIAHSVEDALAVFYTTGLDALFIQDVVFEKGSDNPVS
jgi:carbamoyltransferase